MEVLNDVITSLTSSIVPVGNALLIMLLVTSIYAILAVNFFSCRYAPRQHELSSMIASRK